jgi:hypothetical protein
LEFLRLASSAQLSAAIAVNHKSDISEEPLRFWKILFLKNIESLKPPQRLAVVLLQQMNCMNAPIWDK